MKIVMVTRERPPDQHCDDQRYGLGKSLAPVVSELEKRGCEVIYLNQAHAGEAGLAFLRRLHSMLIALFYRFFSQTDLSSLLWGIIERFNMGRLAARYSQQSQSIHVHCHDPIIAAGYLWFSGLPGRRRNRWGVTEHGFGCYAQAIHEDGVRLGTRVMRFLRRWEARIVVRADWVITPAQIGLGQLARDLGVWPVPPKWQAIYHPRPTLNTYGKEVARQCLGWHDDLFYIIAVGRFVKLKQFPVLLKACADLPQANWRLILLGEGDRQPLKELAERLGIGDRLDFAISDDMGLYYSAADIYVSTSLTESFGLANMEALTFGLPSICTAVGGVPEVLGSGARLIPSKLHLPLVTALDELLTDAGARHYWSRQALEWTAGWPDAETIAESYMAVYEGRPVPASALPGRLSSNVSLGRLSEWQSQVSGLSACLLPKVLELPKNMNVLVLAPHSDDETIGCGGTISLLQQNGCRVKVVLMTDGSQGDPLGYCRDDVGDTRCRESRQALAILGVDDLEFIDQPDGCFQATESVVGKLDAIMASFEPQWFLIPSILDYHRDHVAVSLAALQLWQERGYREQVFLYEIWEPVPATRIVDVTEVLTLKQRAMECYRLPLQYCDYVEAFNGIMRYRGICLEQASGKYAEAFLELHERSWHSVVAHLFALRKHQEVDVQGNA